MSNRLSQETSPYLLQHANNPVDWYPWGEEALQKAAAENKPIFLSVGYSACHWCHVMEHESFEDPQIAAFLNEHFISIKVDREERPDLDQIYMNAVQLLTGHGGWPMSVFLTPQGQPFYGGTYWPNPSRMGMPGFGEICRAVLDAWTERRDQAIEQAGRLTEAVGRLANHESDSGLGQPALSRTLLDQAAERLKQNFDATHGGWGTQPKFPHPMDIRLLLRLWAGHQERRDWLEMVELTLQQMASGGIYDHLGGGFHRYSVDRKWLVPHFEKMLYDNAQLAVCYVEAFQITGNPLYRQTARETLDYILREMTHQEGGFFSTQDADSEGVEGKFYVWTPEQIAAVLGPERAATFCRVYDVTPEGNFEGRSILNLPKIIQQQARILSRSVADLQAELDQSRAELLAARRQRIPPGLDDKILVSWNSLAIEALALAGAVFWEPRYVDAASQAAEFLLSKMSQSTGRLLHSWRDGQAKFDAYLDDYAYFANALLTLYEATFQPRWVDQAGRLAKIILERFSDPQNGGFFYTADDHEQLITRNKEYQDGSVPSSISAAATLFGRLAKMTGQGEFAHAAEGTLQSASSFLQQFPNASCQMLIALDGRLSPFREFVIAGSLDDADTTTVIQEAWRQFLPHRLIALASPNQNPPGGSEYLADLCRGAQEAKEHPALFVCENFTCQQPVTGVEPAVSRLRELGISSEQKPE